jgi:AcrR family transcriptional regulator
MTELREVPESVRSDDQTKPARLLGAREVHRAKRTEEILAASMRVLGEGGYAAFSMRKVAAAAGVRLNTVQHFYGDLQTLLVATVRAKVSVYVDRYTVVAADDRLPPRERLEAVFDDVFAEVRKPEVTAFFLEAWSLGAQDPSLEAVLKEIYFSYFSMLASMVRQIKADLSMADSHVIAALLGSVTEGALVYSRFGNNGEVPIGAVMVRMKALCMSLVGDEEKRSV